MEIEKVNEFKDEVHEEFMNAISDFNEAYQKFIQILTKHQGYLEGAFETLKDMDQTDKHEEEVVSEGEIVNDEHRD